MTIVAVQLNNYCKVGLQSHWLTLPQGARSHIWKKQNIGAVTFIVMFIPTTPENPFKADAMTP